MEITAQIISLVASALNIGSFQMKDNKRLYICQSIGSVLFSISFFMLGSYTGALLNLLNIFRGAVLIAGKKWCKPYMLVLIQLLYISAGIITYQNYLSIIPTVVQLIGTFAMWTRSGKVMRIAQLCAVSPGWLFYNIMTFTIGGIITEVFSLVSVIVSIARYGLNGFEDEHEKKQTTTIRRNNELMMDTIKINRKNTKMIAHRGLSGLERENSCAAFIAAGNRDYFGIETDVRTSADNVFVILHDGNPSRVSPYGIDIASSTFEEIRKVELYDMDDVARPHLKIPTLEEYLKICEKYGKVGVLELKPSYTKEDVLAIINMVKEHNSIENMVFISFNFQNLVYLRECSEEANIQFLSSSINDEIIEKCRALKIDLDLAHGCVTKELVDQVHALGMVLNCWTVNDPERGQQLVDWGVDYITTNILQ